MTRYFEKQTRCRAPALSRSLCRGPALFVSGRSLFWPGALCVAPRRSLCRADPALSVSGPSAVYIRPQRSVGAQRCSCRGPALCVWPSLCRGLALSVSGPPFFVSAGAFSLSVSGCVGARRSLCRGPALAVSGPGTLSLSVSGPVSQRSLCRGPALSVSEPGPVSGPGSLCVGAWRSLCRSPALFVSGVGTLCRGPSVDVKSY